MNVYLDVKGTPGPLQERIPVLFLQLDQWLRVIMMKTVHEC